MRIMKEGSTLNRRDAAIGSTTGCARVIHCGPLPGRPRSAAEREEREAAWLALSRPRRWLVVVRAGEWCGVVVGREGAGCRVEREQAEGDVRKCDLGGGEKERGMVAGCG